MRFTIFLLSLFSLIWSSPHKDLGDSANGQRTGKWIEYEECRASSYYVREGNYVNGKREGLWSEKSIGFKGEVYAVNKLHYSNGVLIKRERDYVQDYEIKKAQDDAKQAYMNADESYMKHVMGEKEYNKQNVRTDPNERYDLKNGAFVGHYENGKKHEEGVFKDGKLDGPYILYTREEFEWELHTYKDGILDGEFVRWFYNSKLKWQQRDYKSGLLDGYALTFFGNGRLQEKTLYAKGVRQGESVSWYKNGRKQKEATYVDNKEDGGYRFWYENGQIRDDAIYNKGKLVNCKYLKGKPCIKNGDSAFQK